MSDLTNPPFYTSWRNLARGEAAAKTGCFADVHLTNVEAISLLQEQLQASHRREEALQERLNEAEECRPSVDLARRRLDHVRELKHANRSLFRWSCLGYLLALGCLTYIFATGSI